jgi:hypothetical protein
MAGKTHGRLANCFLIITMTPELQKYYEDRFSMMATPGWADLLEDVDKIISTLQDISTIDGEKDLQFKKGELSILTWLRNLKTVSEQAYEDLNAQDV